MLERRLKGIFRGLKNEFVRLSTEVRSIEEKEREICIDQELECVQLEERPLDFHSLREHLQYLNEERSNVKRLFPLNNSEFISSGGVESGFKPEGQLKIYEVGSEKKRSSFAIKEGSYGLLVHNKYILAGTTEGYFSFYHEERTDFQELSPRLFGTYNDKTTIITDILPLNRRHNGFNLLALGNRKVVKSFFVEECELHPGIRSLIFEETHTIEKDLIWTVEIMKDKQELLMGCNGALLTYDLLKGAYGNELALQADILRIKRSEGSLAFLAQRRAISAVDLRTASPRKFTFKCDVTALCALNQHSLIYGTERGEVGLFDLRKEAIAESNTLCHRQAKIYDIIKHNETIISGDSDGQIVSWKGL